MPTDHTQFTYQTRGSLERNVRRAGIYFIVPATVLLLIVYVVPICLNIFYGFTSYSLLSKPVFVGLKNYLALMHESLFWVSGLNTIIWSASVVTLGTAASLGVALLLSQNIVGIGIYRTIAYLPQSISFASVSLIWLWLFDPNYGPIDHALVAIGLNPVNWLTNPHLAMPSLMLASIWRDVGYYMLIFIAALQNVPKSFIEAAQLDGANKWQVFWHVTLPVIQPSILFVVLTWTIGSLQMFTQSFIMTEGGPGYATTTMMYKIYKDGFGNLKLGYASAESMMLFIVTLILSIVFVRLFRRSIQG